MISRLVTERAPWRCAVPMQSAPVSPPPMTMTSLPVAVTCPTTLCPNATRFAGGRKSMACMTPSSSRPGTGRSRGTVAPMATTTASNRLRRSEPVRSLPISTPVRKRVPSDFIWAMRRSSTAFSILNSGMP